MAKIIKKVAILGPGGIGGFLAAVFWKNKVEVTCIGTDNDTEAIKKNGFHLSSKVFGDFIARPGAETNLNFRPDILLITIKAIFLDEALNKINPSLVSDSVITPLLNGFEHIGIIRKKLGNRVAAGMIGNIEVRLNAPASAVHLTDSRPQMEIASDSDIDKVKLLEIAGLFSSFGIPAKVLNRESEVVWNKLTRLNAIALTTAASQQPLGFVRADSWWREKLIGIVGEGVGVAKAEGVDLDPELVLKQIDSLSENLTTSLQRDVASGLLSEAEAIPGAVLRLAKKYHLPHQNLEEVFQLLKKRIG